MQQEIKIPINLGTKEEQIKDSNSPNIRISSSQSKDFFKSTREKWVFIAFILPPFVISMISMLHMITLFETSNSYWMAVSIAIAVELAAISSLVALVVLDKLSKNTIWSMFFTLAILQIIGNCYSSYRHLSIEAITNISELLLLDLDFL